MYSGKTKALIERGYRAEVYGDVPTYYFKPSVDTRDVELKSRNGTSREAVLVDEGMDIFEYMKDKEEPSIIIIDEAQFFDEGLIYAVQLLKLRDHNILAAGLNLDFRGQPFGVMPKLMALADSSIQKIYPVCTVDGCVNDSHMPQRLRNGKPDSALSPTVVIEGSSDEIEYRPVCIEHYEIPDLEEYILSKINSDNN